ncbi:hypothetical protein D9756_002551 [Leucocoprinus leucothites]|uniref:Serine dehydratase beta chain domain-containing protein n=1 Tax=Leucocoprinus leucothites TaxID=201217 RepID=A0A8H5GD04_9AGAR|nr:hypothetical protein D9756_002551 [Leucoagaricus leucothites]
MLAKVSRSLVASPSSKRPPLLLVSYTRRSLPATGRHTLPPSIPLATKRWLNTVLHQEPRDEHHPQQQKLFPEHAVISTFDLFSIGVGPSSSHTVGPMRAGRIFITDLKELNLLEKVHTIKINLYGSLAATGKGHHTPQAILLGLEGSDPETIDTGTIPSRYTSILQTKSLTLGGAHRIHYDQDRDMLWRYDIVLKTHPNGMRFSAFDEDGDLLATNEYFSVGGGFVVNDKTKVDENLFYKGVDKKAVHGARLHQSHSLAEPLSQTASLLPGTSEASESVPGDPVTTASTDSNVNTNFSNIDPDTAPFGAQTEGSEQGQSQSANELLPPYPFDTGATLLALTQKHNLSIAQIVHDNEKSFGYTDEEIHEKFFDVPWRRFVYHCHLTFWHMRFFSLLLLIGDVVLLIEHWSGVKIFYPGIASPGFDVPAIGPGSGRVADAISGPRFNTNKSSPTTTHFEDDDKSVYELVEEQDPTSKNGEVKPDESLASQAAKRKGVLAKMKYVPKIVGSVDHAIMPMPPVSSSGDFFWR